MGKEKTVALERAKKATAKAKGKEDQPGRIFVEVRPVAWLDPGGLDSVYDTEGRPGGSGQRRLDCPRVLEAAGERVRASTARG